MLYPNLKRQSVLCVKKSVTFFVPSPGSHIHMALSVGKILSANTEFVHPEVELIATETGY